MDNQKQVEFKGNNRFLIRRCLGSGGFGTVYEVYDKERGATVALKTLHQADAEALYRFKQEFRLLADITHPNLITLYELMSEGETWFFTMEIIKGVDFLEYLRTPQKTPQKTSQETETIKVINTAPNANDPAELETIETPNFFKPSTMTNEVETIKLDTTGDKLKTGDQSKEKKISTSINQKTGPPKPEFTLDPNLIRKTLKQLVEGIHSLHETGKLHRDIKPSNVLVTKEGRVVILDFGIATELSFQKESQRNSDIVGTPAYMSPEQSAAMPLSEATDWYSVGVMLFEVLTGKRPFNGQAFDLMAYKQQFEAPKPSTLINSIPLDLDLLCQQLLKKSPYERPSGLEILQRLTTSTSGEHTKISIPYRISMPFVGRNDYLSLLKESFRIVKEENRPATVYIEGRSGMGKSALVRHFLDELRLVETKIIALTGRCYEQESVPYKALDDLIDSLSNYLKLLPSREVRPLLSTDILALARLFPVLNQVPAIANSERTVLDIPDSQELKRRAFIALKELLRNLATKTPLILYIDDLQWGDIDSAGLLSELLAPPNAPPFLLITTYRSEDVNSSPFLTFFFPLRLKADPKIEVKEIALKELSKEESQALAIALLGKNNSEMLARAEKIAQESKGSPFFVDELVQYVNETATSGIGSSEDFEAAVTQHNTGQLIEKPSDISHSKQEDSTITRLDSVIYTRVTRLPEEARKLLEIIAVAGQPLERTIAKQASELDVNEQSAFALLRSNRMIRVSGAIQKEMVETYHDRIRETVVANLTDKRLKDCHSELASYLEEVGADAERLAIHFYKAGRNKEAAKYAVIAANNAYNALAFERAATLYQLALDLKSDDLQTHTLQVKLAESIANVGNSYQAANAYLAATKTAEGVEVLKLHQSAADQFLRGGFLKEGFDELSLITKKVGIKIPKTPLQALFLFLFLRVKIKLRGLEFKEATKVTEEDLLRLNTFWTVSTSLSMFDATRGAVLQSEFLLFALKVGDLRSILRALLSEAGYAASAGGRKAKHAEKLLKHSSELAKRLNSPLETAITSHVAGIVAGCLGQWKRCIDEFTTSELIFRKHCTGVSADIDRGYYWIFNSYFFIGDLNQLFERLPGVLKDISERGNLIGEINLRLRNTYMKFLADDQAEKAKEELDITIDRWSKKGFQMQHFWHLFGKVQSCLYNDETKAAWETLDQKWSTISRSLFLRIQSFYIQILHLRARCALAMATSQENRSNSRKFLKTAERDAKAIEKENMPWGNAFAKQIRASVLALKGDRETAIKLILEAENNFESVDMMLYRTALKHCRGQLMSNPQGELLIKEANEWMLKQQIKKPEAMVKMLTPGNWNSLP